MEGDWDERFERFVDHKTQTAVSARLCPLETAFADVPADATAIGNSWSRRLFDGSFYTLPSRDSSRPACSLVFVQSSDGNTVVPNPKDLGGGDTDKHLIYEGLSRVAADAVMAGAETVRDLDVVFSVWHPELVRLRTESGLPRHPVQVLATLRGLSVERMLICNVPRVPVIFLTIASAAERMRQQLELRPWISVVVMNGEDDLPAAFHRLKERGVRRISCVGGRTLASALLRHRLVDDVHLTTAARPGGTPNTPISSTPWRGRVLLRKRGSGSETGVTFEHLLTG